MSFLDALLARDPEALARLRRTRILAAAGDASADRSFKAMAAAYFARRHPAEWRDAHAHYLALSANAPRSKEALAETVNLARAGDHRARLRLSMLRTLAPRSSAAAPGAPQIGYHPMPSRVRYGVSFGQLPQLPVPLFTQPVLYQVPGFPPVTPQVLMQLLQLIQQALASVPRSSFERERYQPPTEAAPGGLAGPGVVQKAAYAAAAPRTPGMFVPGGATLVQAATPTYSRYLTPGAVTTPRGYPGLS